MAFATGKFSFGLCDYCGQRYSYNTLRKNWRGFRYGDLAELLIDHYPAEQVEAQSHLDFAIEEFRAMKMQPALERALRHKGLLHA